MASIPLEPDLATLEELTQKSTSFILDHLGHLADIPAADTDGIAESIAAYSTGVPEEGCAVDDVLDRIRKAALKSFNTAGPGYLAFIPGGGIYTAALADYMALALNRYVGVSKAAPLFARMESTAIDWIAQLIGMPKGTAGVLTSGGSLSNLIAIATARSEKLADEKIALGTLYYSEQTHSSVAKSAKIAGIGAKQLRPLPVDERRQIRVDAFESAIREDRARGLNPFAVVANAGTTNTGAVDPIREIAAIGRAENIWVHADAAYGGFFRMLPNGNDLIPGLEDCDSVTLDPHKGLFLPYGTGLLLVRDVAALRRAHESTAEYLHDVAADDGLVNFTDLSPELSREFRGLRLWFPFMIHGAKAFRAALEEKMELAQLAYRELQSDSQFDVLGEPRLSIVAFRMRTRDPASSNAINKELIERVNKRGKVFLSSTVLDGQFTLRICVLSFRTHRDRVLDAVRILKEEATNLALA